MSSCFLGVPHSLHSVHVPGHSAHSVSCQEFQPRRQCEGKFAICAILETVCPAHKYSDWHSVWKWVYPGCRGEKNKNMPRGRVTSNMHIHAFLPYIKGLLLGNLKVHSKQIQTLCITFHARQVHPKAVRRKTPFVNESNFVDKQVH